MPSQLQTDTGDLIGTDTKLFQDVRELLKKWLKPDVEHQLSYLQAANSLAAQQQDDDGSPSRQLIRDALDTLATANPAAAELLDRRFLREESPEFVMDAMHLSHGAFYRQQKRAIQKLATIIDTCERHTRSIKQIHYQKRLPPAGYTQLYGVQQPIDQLFGLLQRGDRPHIISIEGIGGIGKTALVRALVTQAIEYNLFTDYGWSSLQRYQLLPSGTIKAPESAVAETAEQVIENLATQILADIPKPTGNMLADTLYERLKTVPHLVVVDNLETLSDYETLLPTLQKLANPSTVIITARERMDANFPIYTYPVSELSEADSLMLIRHQIAISGPNRLTTSNDADLHPIFDLVGGNPLALKLVVGQLKVLSLHEVLNYLGNAQIESIENLYTFIYRRAWELLDDVAKTILMGTVALPNEGGDLERLCHVTDMETTTLVNTLHQLIALNLIDRHHGSVASENWYRIHSLTRTFLQNDILEWR